MAKEQQEEVVERRRSPACPTLGLREAIAKIGVLWEQDKGQAATQAIIAQHLESSTKSSAFLQWMGSLKQYGLIQPTGEGSRRAFKPTKLAADIMLLGADDPGRGAAIAKAALNPPIFKGLWSEYGKTSPSDPTIEHFLVTQRGFHPDTATKALHTYKKTVEYAKLNEYDSTVDDNQKSWPVGFESVFKGFVVPPVVPEDKKNSEKTPRFKQEVFALDEGEIAIRWPARISSESLEDVKDWFEILQRKIARCVQSKHNED